MRAPDLLELRMELPIFCDCRCHGAETAGMVATSEPVPAVLACTRCCDKHVAALIDWPEVRQHTTSAADATAWCDEEGG